MAQQSNHDAYVLELIRSGRIEVDIATGRIYGRPRSPSAPRPASGYRMKQGWCFTFQKEGRAFTFPMARTVYLAAYGAVPTGMAVKLVDEEGRPDIGNLRLGAPIGRPPQPRWTEEELDSLRELRDSLSLSELAARLRRSQKAVRQQIKRLQMPSKGGDHQPWSAGDDAALERHYRAGKSVEDIAAAIHRSAHAVRLRANRLLGAFRSDKHLQTTFRSKNFYLALKQKLVRGTAGARCCLCDYSKHVDLHHIDGDRTHNAPENIASLCPNHHREVTAGEHSGVRLCCIWWRVYASGRHSEVFTTLPGEVAG